MKKEEIRRDPILFGTFEQRIDGIYDICDRFYYIGDWEDEYCDLTLTKMVQKMSENGRPEITHELSIPEITQDSVREYLNRLDEVETNRFTLARPRKKSFIDKVKTTWRTWTNK